VLYNTCVQCIIPLEEPNRDLLYPDDIDETIVTAAYGIIDWGVCDGVARKVLKAMAKQHDDD